MGERAGLPFHNWAYTPSCSTNLPCEPLSATFPSCNTIIRSLSNMVRNLCATKTLVRDFSLRMLLMFWRRFCSVFVSRAEVWYNEVSERYHSRLISGVQLHRRTIMEGLSISGGKPPDAVSHRRKSSCPFLQPWYCSPLVAHR